MSFTVLSSSMRFTLSLCICLVCLPFYICVFLYLTHSASKLDELTQQSSGEIETNSKIMIFLEPELI